jgi:hypothetical protein
MSHGFSVTKRPRLPQTTIKVADMPEEDQKYWSFPHRQNKNGTFDSICPKCFLTVANAIQEVDLVRFEKCHVCDHTGTTVPKEDGIEDRFGDGWRLRQ